MTLDEIRAKEKMLQHAIAYAKIYEHNGNSFYTIKEHFLTCLKCQYREMLGLPKENPFYREIGSENDGPKD